MHIPMFLPILVFLGIVGVGLILKRILPAGTTIPRYLAVGLVSAGAIILVLVIIAIVLLALNIVTIQPA